MNYPTKEQLSEMKLNAMRMEYQRQQELPAICDLDFDERFSLVEEKRPALETVRLATLTKIGRFTKQDIRELCPSLSISSIEGSLRALVENGELRREGSGKNTGYVRIR